MVEGARLESEYGSKAHRGFESHPLRHFSSSDRINRLYLRGICSIPQGVEDNPQVGEFATQALRELGYDRVLAADADAALAELDKACDRLHIVFSDVVMPGMNGIELGEEIRRRHPQVPVLLTSSHVLAQNGNHGFQLLHKPYSVEHPHESCAKRFAGRRARSRRAEAEGYSGVRRVVKP